MTQEEIALQSEIENLTSELEKIKSDFKTRISDLSEQLLQTSLLVNKGKRRLITSQGDELLEEVANCFNELGYSVRKMDEEILDGIPKKEDLRIKDPENKNWEAIVEVRGHTKSSGQASDLTRLSRFARLYQSENGKEPSKLIYIVNGQIELPSPEQRQVPFAAAPDEIEAFGEQDGLIIWTLDLFKIFESNLTEINLPAIRKSLRDSTGRWAYDLNG